MRSRAVARKWGPRKTVIWRTRELWRDARVRLAVYDVAGRQMMLLIDGEQRAGGHDVLVDGSRLASGVYFYRLEAAGSMA